MTINIDAPSVASRFRRSVQLEHDYAEGSAALSGYQATPLALQTLKRVLSGLSPVDPVRAWSIVGVYGTGKSAFSLFLAHVLQTPPDQRADFIRSFTPHSIQHDLQLAAPRLLPLILNGNNSSLGTALIAALQNLPLSPALHTDIDRLHHDHSPAAIAQIFEEASAYIATTTAFDGIIVLIDELGQFLDYAVRHHDQGIFVLQLLAEMAVRTPTSVFAIVTILHQAFDRYAQGSSRQRSEWAKIQGRFVDVPFQEPASQMIRMIGTALANTDIDAPNVKDQVEQLAYECEFLHLRPADISGAEWRDIIAQCYPLHPTVVLVLPFIFRQFAQNERSLFAFLASTEPHSIHDVWQQQPQQWYRLQHLFAYIESTMGMSLFNRARGRRWAELVETRLRLQEYGSTADAVLTVIGTLNALGQPNVPASEALVSFALSDQRETADVISALQILQQRQFITFRRYRSAWVLWEGSDLDLDGMIQRAFRDIQVKQSLIDLLRSYADALPLVAQQHSYRTGALRVFEFRFVDRHELQRLTPLPHVDGGEIVCCVLDADDVSDVTTWLTNPATIHDPARIIVVPNNTDDVREALLDVAAMQHVLLTEDVLQNDAPARRELASRLVEAQQTVSAHVRSLTGVESSQWWWRGGVQLLHSARDRDALLSTICDQLFQATPHIWNELIVRRQISGTVAKARRILIELMLTTPDGQALPFEGTPPERAIYESVMLASGIHRPDERGVWHWAAPSADDPCHLAAVWQAMLDWLELSVDEPQALSTLYDRLEAAPYGVKAGLHPLLFTACFMAHRGELAMYEHGTFVPMPDVPMFERLQRQPATFSVRLSRVEGARRTVYDRFVRALAPQLVGQATPQLMLAVAPLLTLVRRLPEWSRHTRSISPTAQAVRAALLAARAPDTLLFEELPQVCGVAAFAPTIQPDAATIELFFTRLRESLTELQEAYSQLIQHTLTTISDIFNLPHADNAHAHHDLRSRYNAIEPLIHDQHLRTFGLRLAQTHTPNGWIESLGAFVAHKPMPQWTDDDVLAFRLHLTEIARRFRQIEELALTQQMQSEALPLVRVSVTTSQGEQSMVVEQHGWSPTMHQLHHDINQLFSRYVHLSHEQQVAVLTDMLQNLVQPETMGETQ